MVKPALLMPQSLLGYRLMDRVWRANIFGEDLFKVLDNWADTRYHQSVFRCPLPLLVPAILLHSELPFVRSMKLHVSDPKIKAILLPTQLASLFFPVRP